MEPQQVATNNKNQNMKKLSLLAAVVLGSLVAFSNTAIGQDAQGQDGTKGKRGQTVEQQMERMTKNLDLTDAQKPKVKALLEETNKKRQDIRANTAQADQREKMRAVMQDQQTKLKAILTPEQWQKYEKQQEELKKKGKGGGKKKAA
jgi:periplasmic protein CpxP/Spy